MKDMELIQAATHESVYAFADIVVKSELAPKSFNTKEKVIMALAYGRELGITPMQSLQGLNVINGKIGIGGDLAKALCEADPSFEGVEEETGGEGDEFGVTVTIRRKNRPPLSRRFTLGDARQAKLLGKQGPWTDYTDRMLYYRALGFALRDAFPHVMKGIKTIEELRDEPITPTITQPVSILGPKPAGEDPAPHTSGNAVPVPNAPKRGRGRPKVEKHEEKVVDGGSYAREAINEERKGDGEGVGGDEEIRTGSHDPSAARSEDSKVGLGGLAPKPEAHPSPEDEKKAILVSDLRGKILATGTNELALIGRLIGYKFKQAGKPIGQEISTLADLNQQSLTTILENWKWLAAQIEKDK